MYVYVSDVGIVVSKKRKSAFYACELWRSNVKIFKRHHRLYLNSYSNYPTKRQVHACVIPFCMVFIFSSSTTWSFKSVTKNKNPSNGPSNVVSVPWPLFAKRRTNSNGPGLMSSPTKWNRRSPNIPWTHLSISHRSLWPFAKAICATWKNCSIPNLTSSIASIRLDAIF